MANHETLLPAGKLPMPLLARLLDKFAGQAHDPRLIVGPRPGEDAAVIDFGDRYLIAKTDPITFATGEIGWYAVNVNANDVAVMGGVPRWFLATVLLPAGKATAGMAESIFVQLRSACESLEITMAGGHTEITHDLDRPIVCGTMLGEADPGRLITTAGARVGDAVLLVKPVPIEGTALIALERSAALAAAGYSLDFIARCQAFLHAPGISVVRPAMLAVRAAEIHAMHDPTEGGVATGLLEIAHAAEVGLDVDLDAIPIPPESAALCREFGLNPLGLLASGAILLTMPYAGAGALRATLEAAGYPTALIGRVTPSGEGLLARRGGQRVSWPTFEVDEIARLFA